MPGMVGPVNDEREGLLGYLGQQRYLLRVTAYGLSDEQAKMTPTPSSLSVGGIIKPLSSVERFWMSLVTQRPLPRSDDEYQANFRIGPGETLGSVLEGYSESARFTDATVASLPLSRPV